VSTGIPPFDPRIPRSRCQNLLQEFVRTPLGRRCGIDLAARVDPWLLRISHGRIGAFIGAPNALLTTTGARTGEPRSAAVLYFTDGEDVILIASNFARERHPAWYHNLKAHPEAVMQRAGISAKYIASEVREQGEHERLFSLAESLWKGYGDYRERTGAFGRHIPIMRLKLFPAVPSTSAPPGPRVVP
jgi:deazaflavin-dependent oxidoreductase (nitroreductase family)